MLDVRIPMGLLFTLLGALLFFYGMFISQPVPFYTPNSWFPLKLNQPVGLFMFIFGVLMLALARFVRIHTADRELGLREQELDKAERKRQRALERQKEKASGDESSQAVDDLTEASSSVSSSENETETAPDAAPDASGERK